MPPALVYKHRAIYDRQRAKLNPGTEQLDLADDRGLGAAGLEAPSRSRCRRGSCAPEARRGCSSAELRPGLPLSGRCRWGSSLGLALAWRSCAPQLLQRRHPARDSQTSIPLLFYLRPGPAKTPRSREKEIRFGS